MFVYMTIYGQSGIFQKGKTSFVHSRSFLIPYIKASRLTLDSFMLLQILNLQSEKSFERYLIDIFLVFGYSIVYRTWNY